MNANKKNGFVAFRAREAAAALLSIGSVHTSLQRGTPSLSWQRGTCQPTFMRFCVRLHATRIFFRVRRGCRGGPYTSRPAAQQPSHKSSPRTCCYGSSLSARARYPHIAAAARPRTPSGSYAARRSAAAETPLPLASHPAIRPDVSGASGNPSPETPTQSHRTPNASPKPSCPSDSPGGVSPSSSRRPRTAARSATGAAPKRR